MLCAAKLGLQLNVLQAGGLASYGGSITES